MNIRPRDRVALVVMGALALLAAFYLLALKPERQKVTALDSQITAAQATLAQAQQSYATGKAAQASLKADAAEWAALRLAVPSQSDIPALLRTLQDTAAQVHVKMQAISLSPESSTAAAAAAPAPSTTSTTATTPASSTAGTSTATSAPDATAAAPQETPVPVQLTFAGGYTALNNLVRRLDDLVQVSGGAVRANGPLLSISNVSLSGAPKLTVQLTASLYQLSAPTSATGTTTGGQG
jgi:type II secretory pathway pseudopilin PulG